MLEMNNYDFKACLKQLYEREIPDCGNLFTRINFKNVVKEISRRRTIAWLKAKYFLLIHESLEDVHEKTSEQIITLLHEKFCSNACSSVNNGNIQTNRNNNSQTEIKDRVINNSSSNFENSILISDDEEYNYVDLTLLSDDIIIDDDIHSSDDIIIDSSEDVVCYEDEKNVIHWSF